MRVSNKEAAATKECAGVEFGYGDEQDSDVRSAGYEHLVQLPSLKWTDGLRAVRVLLHLRSMHFSVVRKPGSIMRLPIVRRVSKPNPQNAPNTPTTALPLPRHLVCTLTENSDSYPVLL